MSKKTPYPKFLSSTAQYSGEQNIYIFCTTPPHIILKLRTDDQALQDFKNSSTLLYCNEFYFLEILNPDISENNDQLLDRMREWVRSQINLRTILLP